MGLTCLQRLILSILIDSDWEATSDRIYCIAEAVRPWM